MPLENRGFSGGMLSYAFISWDRGRGSVVYAVEDAVNEGGFACTDVDVGFVVVLVEEDYRGVHHYGYFMLEFYDGVDVGQWDAVEGRFGRQRVDYEVGFVVDGYIVVFDEILEKESDIKVIG